MKKCKHHCDYGDGESVCKCEGYVVRYNIPSFNCVSFKPGCFINKTGDKVPLIDCRSGKYDYRNIIGYAELEIKEDGLYCHCNIYKAEKSDRPKGFTFFANKVKREVNDKEIIHECCVKEIGLWNKENPTCLIEKFDET